MKRNEVIELNNLHGDDNEDFPHISPNSEVKIIYSETAESL